MSETTTPVAQPRNRKRIALAAGFAATALTLTGVGVFAGLNATTSGSQSVSSGTLKLTMAANGTGFGAAITNMAPGDQVNRYVDLTSGGSLDAQALTLKVTDSTATPTALSTDAVRGLRVAVTSCSGSWAPTTGVCTGTTSVLLAATPVATLGSTPGSVLASVPSGTTLHLQVATVLPDSTETTTDGTLPANTIQGLAASLTYTFNENQRTATTTNS